MLGIKPHLYSVKPPPDFMAMVYEYVYKYSITHL